MNQYRKPEYQTNAVNRRDWSLGLGSSLGMIALSALLRDDPLRASEEGRAEKAEPDSEKLTMKERSGHFSVKAKRCIFLMMEGGPSHIDTFDPKPKLNDLHLSRFQRRGKQKSAMESGTRYFVQSPFKFGRHGESGASMASNWANLKDVADELCFYRGCQVDSVNHPTAMYQMNCGNQFGGDPGIGAWVTYGLGSVNQNLPGYVVLPEVSFPQGGAANWSNGYLPTSFQGTPLRPKGSPILDLQPQLGMGGDRQRDNLDLLNQINSRHALLNPQHQELLARLENYELAYRMQSEIPATLDIAAESKKTLDAYGVGEAATDSFGRKCLLARKLVEKGVRFVQLYNGSWDSHDYIERAHGNLVKGVDQPITALIKDLKSRGLLESTLVVWCGEFGRSPDNGVRGGTAYGRDHNPSAMTIWMAGGGCKAGHTIGATDETGAEAVEEVHHVRDFHVTLLRLMGLDDNQLTFYHAGRHKQLSQFGGKVIEPLIA